jgi:MFS family permease
MAADLSIGMIALAILLLIRTETGSFALAGVVSGGSSLATAVGIAVQGRLIDRYGLPAVLRPASAASVLLFAALVLASLHRVQPTGLVLLALAAGACSPATAESMRSLCPALVDEQARTAAYALLSLMLESGFVCGPLLVAALVALAGPAVAVLAGAAVASAAGWLLASTSAARGWRGAQPAAARSPSWYVNPGVATLLIAVLAVGVASGLVQVGVPAFAIAHRSAALSGVLLACLSLGSIGGSFVYGSRTWRASLTTRMIAGQAVFVLVLAGCAAAGATIELGGLLVVAGLAMAPISISSSALLDYIAPPNAITQAFSLMVAAWVVGISAGTALGGAIAGAAGPGVVLICAAAAMAASVAWTLTRRRAMRTLPADLG